MHEPPPLSTSLSGRFLACLLAASATFGCTGSAATRTTPSAAPAFVHAEGDHLVDAEDNPIELRGVSLGTWDYVAPDPPLMAHDASAYAEIASVGANSARLLFNYQLLEDDGAPYNYKQSGLDWLDQNVAWAKENGLYLVLSLSVPPGGNPGNCGNDALWDDPENQKRLIALWRMLAERYAREPTVAAYVPLDQANPDASLAQWGELATRVVHAIREVDREHLVRIVHAISIACTFDLPPEQAFAAVDDRNVAYEIDDLKPWSYVSQDIAANGAPAYGAYPGHELNIDGSKATWLHPSRNDSHPAEASLILPDGDSPWAMEHFYYTVSDPSFDFAQVVLQSDFNPGTAYFDDITVKEYDEAENPLGVVADLDLESLDPWYFYENDADGNQLQPGTGTVALASDAHRGKASISISGTTSYASLSDQPAAFLVRLGHTYELTGWMKGEDVSAQGSAMIRLDFFKYDGSLTGGDDRGALAATLDDFATWGNGRKVPLGISGFGTDRTTFDHDLGGLDWVSDNLDLMLERKFSFSYYAYHEPTFGIYDNTDGLPDPSRVNQPLLDLLTAKLR
jgi:hypothetical protein